MDKTMHLPISILATLLALFTLEACSRKQASSQSSSTNPVSGSGAEAQGRGDSVHMTTVLPTIAAADGAQNALPFDPGSTRGAVGVLKVYYSMISAKRFSDALIWREDSGPSSPLADAAFASGFERYESYSAKVGQPGQPNGPPGSVHVAIPVEVHGRLKTGAEVTEGATVEMHRINDTAEAAGRRMSWRIDRIDMRPAN